MNIYVHFEVLLNSFHIRSYHIYLFTNRKFFSGMRSTIILIKYHDPWILHPCNVQNISVFLQEVALYTE